MVVKVYEMTNYETIESSKNNVEDIYTANNNN